MSNSIKRITPLSFPWETKDPFLFCVHHEDFYPKGNEDMGPDVSLAGRTLGNDFAVKDGFRMYHGMKVPGFPAHPHRGFETVTIARKGYVDHSDSLGAAGRFGNGDVQWMTAGKGVQHCEMFPLINREGENPFEIFQIWLNLPAKNKLSDPYFAMLWNEEIPNFQFKDNNGKKTDVKVVAGKLENAEAPAPAPNSWAANPYNEVAIWNIKMESGAEWTLPTASEFANRTIYFFKGATLEASGSDIPFYHAVELKADEPVLLKAGEEAVEILLLQGRPIGEPVAQYGPFVMNNMNEIQQAINEFRQTEFGGWPWPSNGHVHPREKGRFAKYVDGTVVEP